MTGLRHDDDRSHRRSCHHLTRLITNILIQSRDLAMIAKWHQCGTMTSQMLDVPVFRRLFDRLPVRISTSDLHHRILRKKIYHVRAYNFGVQFSFKIMAVTNF